MSRRAATDGCPRPVRGEEVVTGVLRSAWRVLIGVIAVGVVLVAPNTALLAEVINGSFETGDLDGWQVER